MKKFFLPVFGAFLFLSLFLLFSFFQRGGFMNHGVTTRNKVSERTTAAVLGTRLVFPSLAITPISSEFGLVVEDIGVNAPILDVDGFNEKEYQSNIFQGVGHFRKRLFLTDLIPAAYPGDKDNIFLFGHSQIPGGDTGHYKGVFNNLGQLENGDFIVVYYQGQPFYYEVYETGVVEKTALEYLTKTKDETLTLMTCWPLGLDIKRIIVRAKRI